MKTTLKQKILDTHELLNAQFFKGLLNTPNFIFYNDCIMNDFCDIFECPITEDTNIIDFSTFERVHGYYMADTNTIGLVVDDEIYNTLAHEMIHQYQQELNFIDKDHGRTFRKYARIIESTYKLKRGSI